MGKAVYCKECHHLEKTEASYGTFFTDCNHPSNICAGIGRNMAYSKPKKITGTYKTIKELNKNNDCELWEQKYTLLAALKCLFT